MTDWCVKSCTLERRRFASVDISPPWKMIWEYDVGAATASAEVSAAAGTVYAATNRGAVHAIDSAGRRLWVSHPGKGKGLCPQEPPVVAGTNLIVAMEGRLDCLARGSGETRWSVADTAGADMNDGAPVNLEHDFYVGVLAASKDSVLVGSRRNIVREVSLADGIVQGSRRIPIGRLFGAGGRIFGIPWERTSEPRIGWVDARDRYLETPIGPCTARLPGCVSQDLLLLPTDEAMICVDLTSGALRWRSDYCDHETGDRRDIVMKISADDQCVYSVRHRYVSAFSLQDGQRLWKSAGPKRNYLHSEPTISPQFIYVMGRVDGVASIDILNKHTGEIVWTSPLSGAGSARTVVIANGQAIVEVQRRVQCYTSATPS